MASVLLRVRVRPPVAARLVHRSSKYVIPWDPRPFCIAAHARMHRHQIENTDLPAQRLENGGGEVKELAAVAHPGPRSFCTALFPPLHSVINLTWLCVAVPLLAHSPGARHTLVNISNFCSRHEPMPTTPKSLTPFVSLSIPPLYFMFFLRAETHSEVAGVVKDHGKKFTLHTETQMKVMSLNPTTQRATVAKVVPSSSTQKVTPLPTSSLHHHTNTRSLPKTTVPVACVLVSLMCQCRACSHGIVPAPPDQ